MHSTQEVDVNPKIRRIHALTALASLSGIVPMGCTQSRAQICAKKLDQMRI